MAFPPPTLPTNRTNATPQLDTHAADHNAIAQAINDTVAFASATNQKLTGYRAYANSYVATTESGGTAVIPFTRQTDGANVDFGGLPIVVCSSGEDPTQCTFAIYGAVISTAFSVMARSVSTGLPVGNWGVRVNWHATIGYLP